MSSVGVYHVSTWGEAVGRGVTGTRLVHLEGYAKVNSERYPYCVANEYLASRIAVRLGITVPPGTLVQAEKPGEVSWLTLTFAGGDPLPPINAKTVASALPRTAAALVVFDTFILNTDRHRGNLAYRPSRKRLEVFDHSHALFGPKPGTVDQRLDSARGKMAVTGSVLGGNRQCLIDYLGNPADILGCAETLERELHEDFLIEVCREVRETGLGPTKSECDTMANFLLARRAGMKQIFLTEKDEFTAIDPKDWGLI